MLDKNDLPKWHVQFAYTEEDNVGYLKEKTSMTVPDMTIKLSELVERYRRGSSIDLASDSQYEMSIEDNPLPVDLDFTDVLENSKTINELRETQLELEAKLTELKKAQLKADEIELKKFRTEKKESEAKSD
jgi:hypothetical protein